MERGVGVPVRAILVLALLVGAVWIPAPPASAATTWSFSGGVLRFTGNADPQAVTPGCTAGNVTDNVVAIPGPVPCSSVARLVITTRGGLDSVSFGSLLPADFPSLIDIDANLGKGNDIAATGPAELDLFGGPGRDTLSVYGISPGGYTLSSSGLVAPLGSANLDSFEFASVHLPNGTNTLDASTFAGGINVVGGTGADDIDGSKFNDSFSLGGGSDTANGHGGNDSFTGSVGDDFFDGGEGEDRLFETGLTSNVVLNDSTMTGNGTDTLASVEGAIVGHTGSSGYADSLSGFSGSVTWFGANGNDTVTGSQGGTYFSPGGGSDVVSGGPGEDTFQAGNLSVATLSPGALITPTTTDIFSGIEAFALWGTSGDDALDASAFAGPTDMAGLEGNDVLIGGPGTSTFFADDGDTITGGDGSDAIDTYVQGPGTAVLTDAGMTGLASFTMSSIESATVAVGDATLKATGFSGPLAAFGSDQDEKILAGGGNDRLVLSGGDDKADGGAGRDLVSGGRGDDQLAGGPGSDRCKGGPGFDVLSGCERGHA